MDDKAPPRSVAIVLLSAIGDVVHGMPVAASLRRAWPEARVSWLIQPLGGALVAPSPDVDELILFDRSAGARGFLDVRRRVAGRRFDVVLTLQVYMKAGLLTALLPSPRKVGFDVRRARDVNWLFTTERIPAHPHQHVQLQYYEFLHHLGVPVREVWDFGFSGEELAARDAFFERLDRPALAVVVKTTRAQKDWLPDRTARVLEIAESDLGLRPVLVGSRSPAELAVAAEVERRTRARVVNAMENDIRRLAWLLDGSALLLSPDTGPLHLAAALGTPVVGIFGYTDPKRAGPWGPGPRFVVDRYTRPGESAPSPEFRPGNMEHVTVQEVVERLEEATRTCL